MFPNFSTNVQSSQGKGSNIIGGKPYDEMTDMEKFAFDAEQIKAEQDAKRAMDPNYTGGLTDYELNREANRINQGQQADNAGKNQYGMIGPPEYEASDAYDWTKDMPGSTARVHYTPAGEYIPAMEQSKKEEASKRMAGKDDSEEDKCPEGQKWDPEKKKCYTETWQSYEPFVNAAISGVNALANYMGKDEERRAEAKYKNMTLADAVMPTKPTKGLSRQGLYDVNTGQIPYAGVYGRNYVPRGEYLPTSKKGGTIMHLTDEQIKKIIAMGGQVEFLD